MYFKYVFNYWCVQHQDSTHYLHSHVCDAHVKGQKLQILSPQLNVSAVIHYA